MQIGHDWRRKHNNHAAEGRRRCGDRAMQLRSKACDGSGSNDAPSCDVPPILHCCAMRDKHNVELSSNRGEILISVSGLGAHNPVHATDV